MKIGKTSSLMLACFAVALLLLTGCASPLVRDLQDCVSVSVGVGQMSNEDSEKKPFPVLAADVQLGFVTHPALATSWTYSENIGWRDGDFRGVMREHAAYDPWVTVSNGGVLGLLGSYSAGSVRKGGAEDDSTSQSLKSIFEDLYDGGEINDKYDTTYWEYLKLGLWTPIPPLYAEDVKMPYSLSELTNFNAGVHLGYVTLRVGVNPLEFIELVFTLFRQGWDERDRK